jgi:brefeldin A-inhibited guanine nucleotide-exchange protein
MALEESPPPSGILALVDPMEVHRMFVHSERLDSDAIVEFVRALCTVSMEELRSDRPRVFGLTQIVEVAHFNMSRIRLVRGNIRPTFRESVYFS